MATLYPPARKSLGQHFLHDPDVIARIIEAINPKRDEAMVEIGPGQGAITAPLLDCLDQMDAVEIDKRLVPVLRKRFEPQLSLHEHDALTFDFSALSRQRNQPLRVVGNLPYNISTPLLFHLLEFKNTISDMHIMVQKEVALRICAATGDKNYSRLTIMSGWHAHIEYLFTIGNGAFTPAPKVQSAFIRLRFRSHPPTDLIDQSAFEKLVTQAFSKRRKTLFNALERQISREQLNSLGLNPQMRAENVSMEQFAALANLLSEHRHPEV